MMEAALSERISRVLAETQGLYYRLVLVVGAPRSGKSTALRELRESRGWPLLNVNLALSERLLELTRKQRAVRVPRVLAVAPDALVLENIQPAPRRVDFFERFGRAFARLHRHFGPACGFPHDARLNVDGIESRGVFTALDLLDDVAHGKEPDLGARVLVIGGGIAGVHTRIHQLKVDVRILVPDVCGENTGIVGSQDHRRQIVCWLVTRLKPEPSSKMVFFIIIVKITRPLITLVRTLIIITSNFR